MPVLECWDTLHKYSTVACDRPMPQPYRDNWMLIKVVRQGASNFKRWHFEAIEKPIEDEYNHEWLMSAGVI